MLICSTNLKMDNRHDRTVETTANCHLYPDWMDNSQNNYLPLGDSGKWNIDTCGSINWNLSDHQLHSVTYISTSRLKNNQNIFNFYKEKSCEETVT